MRFDEIKNAAIAAQDACRALMDEHRRITFALARHDKPGWMAINKSMAHLHFDIGDVWDGLEKLTSILPDRTLPPYEMWFYLDHKSVEEAEVHKRLEEFYRQGVRFHQLLKAILGELKKVGMTEQGLEMLSGHLWLVFHFLKYDIEQVTGSKL